MQTRRSRRRPARGVEFALLAFIAAQTQAAQLGDERFALGLGVFITDRDTEARLDATGTDEEGTQVDLERELGLAGSGTVFRMDGYYRFNRRHRIDFAWYDLSRSGSRVIDGEIEWGDEVFPIDTTLTSDFDVNIIKAAYTYSVIARDRGYLGLTAGVYAGLFDSRLAASDIGTSESSELTAPLPVIGLRGEYGLTRRLALGATAELFALEVGDVEGSLSDLYAGLEYRLNRRISLGLGYNRVEIDVNARDESFSGSLNWRYAGALLLLKGKLGSLD